VFIEGAPNKEPNIPGPGNYNPNKPLGHDSLKFSLRGKGLSRTHSTSNSSPGPGEYPVDTLNPSGHYPLSQTRNPTNILFSASKGKRFNYQGNNNFFTSSVPKTPGPGQYDSKPIINGNGNYFDSKIKSSPSKSILGKLNQKDSDAVKGTFMIHFL